MGDGAPAAPALQGDQIGHGEHAQGRGGDAHRQGGVGEGEAGDRDGVGAGDQGHRGHGGEVQAADAEHEQAGSVEDGPRRALGREHTGHRHGRADQDGGDDIGAVPADHRRGLEGAHAGEVHQGDAEAEDQAGREGPAGLAAFGAQGEGGASAEDGEQEGCDRAGQLIAAVHRRRVGQHGDEVGGPDADAGDQGGQHHAQQPRALGTGLGVGEKSEGGEGGGDANDRRQENETRVMLTGDAAQHLEQHTFSPSGD